MPGLAFLNTYPSHHTRSTYLLGIKTFLGVIYARKIQKSEVKHIVARYLREERDAATDIEQFLTSLNGRPPKTIKLFLAATKMFLSENGIDLPQHFWRKQGRRMKGTRALTLDAIPSQRELRRIIQHMPIQGKALYLTLASSGMRIGETLQLELSDLQLDAEPTQVSIRGTYTKTGNSRRAFLSSEATETLQEWLRNRPHYLVASSARSLPKPHYHKNFQGKSLDDDRVFPFESTTAYMLWQNAVRKAGLLVKDPTTKRYTLHPHVLRKFFRTRLGSVIPVDVVEALMGHEGYLTEVYRRYSAQDLANFYLKGESALLVFTSSGDISKLKHDIEGNKTSLQSLVNNLTMENITIRSRLTNLESDYQEIQINMRRLMEEKIYTARRK